MKKRDECKSDDLLLEGYEYDTQFAIQGEEKSDDVTLKDKEGIDYISSILPPESDEQGVKESK